MDGRATMDRKAKEYSKDRATIKERGEKREKEKERGGGGGENN